MDKVEEEVEKILNRKPVGEKYDLYYGTSFDGIPFAILTTKHWWYKVGVIANIEGRVDTSVYEDHKICIHSTQHQTEKKARERIEKCKDELEKGLYNCLFPNPSSYGFTGILHHGIRKESIPREAIINPDKYLEKGDIISNSFALTASHWAIYIGDGKVAYVSGHGGGKSEAVARIGRFYPDFVKPEDEFWKIKFYYCFRKPKTIAAIAMYCVEHGFPKEEYNFFTQNCQHFVTFCAWGLEASPDKTFPEVHNRGAPGYQLSRRIDYFLTTGAY
ncbi:hypothetical protein FO519_007889 [Halicephalobus sp. NKZ332]|nr:hypothetical protein FO519_007889 [Halicephalobus sp. NKZ332]